MFYSPIAGGLIFIRGDGLIHKLYSVKPLSPPEGIKFLTGLWLSCVHQKPHLQILASTNL